MLIFGISYKNETEHPLKGAEMVSATDMSQSGSLVENASTALIVNLTVLHTIKSKKNQYTNF